MKKEDLEDHIICFAGYLDYHKTEMEKNQKQTPSFKDIYESFNRLFKEVIQNNRVAYAAYRLSFAIDADTKERNQK